MKINKPILISTACLLALGAQRARAITDITYSLDWSHNGSFASGSFGTVEIDLTSSTTAKVTFTAASGYAFFDSGIADLNLASPSTVTGSDYSSDISYTGSGNEDGFGAFNFATKSGGSPPTESTVTFTLTDNSGTWSDASTILTDASGYLAAAHISDNGSTYYVGSDGATVVSFNTPPAPDGGTTILMLGSALTGLAAIGRKFLRA